MRQWVKYGSLSVEEERAEIHNVMNRPLDPTRRNTLFWQTAKRSWMGPVSYETAVRRQSFLSHKEWLVACLTTQGREPRDIAALTNMSERTVDIAIRSLKDKVIKELHCEVGGINRAQLTRWFLGL